MSSIPHRRSGSFRFRDFLVILFCLSAAAVSIYLFKQEVFQTVNAQNEKPVGAVIIIRNNVQRRTEGRLLWDRLALDSPVRLGDLIRTAEHSAVTLQIENDFIDLEPNTLVRIQRTDDEAYPFYIGLIEGNISLIADELGEGIMLNITGHRIKAEAGTILGAAAAHGGMELSVSRGLALFFENGRYHRIPSGEMLALNAGGQRVTRPAVVVTYPIPKARYLRDTPQSIVVDFTWNRHNLHANEAIYIEIAQDRNFTQVVQTVGNLGNSARIILDTGVWHWRLSSIHGALSRGSITVTDSMGPPLLSPITDTLFRFDSDFPRLRFQWAQIAEASSYIVEVCRTPNFINPAINRETEAIFLVESTLGPGKWYWRVTPVFPPVYKGATAYSQFAYFSIERGTPAGLVLPEIAPPELFLVSPEHGTNIAGLVALRQPTVFTWEFDGEFSQSRFVLSRSPNPLMGQPAVEILNPGRTVRVNSLMEGNWYWTVEGQTPGGITVRAAQPKLLQVQPIPLLPAPANMIPATGHRIGIPQLRLSRQIDFRWSAVRGANAYIFTLQQEINGRRQTIRSAIVTSPNWRLDNINVLYPGTFYWSVEAVNRNSAGVIQQRGRVGKNSFTLDVPAPGPVFLQDPGVLYGN